ncbi:hypothetical protein HKD28_11750 [Gluconobacter sp. LMG 1744]|uniref:hypothetical protein n=1 Tax=Gluconobacter cadivus TaxID=2728101 RepID=UPI0018854B78|nr:hypothetical protein [Gluconobacter cadivus]MBF0892075.1 hypothetical protein [Gluconobacter cadivus]
MSGRAETVRVRKAWLVLIRGYEFGQIVYAPTAGKARYQRLLNIDSDRATFADLSAQRAKHKDIVLPVADQAVAALDSEQKSALTHTLENGRFYTSTDDTTMCSLALARLVRNGEAYFVLTDSGRTAAMSLMPLYPEYPEYRA